MKRRICCSVCGRRFTVDLKREFTKVHCPCGQYIDMMGIRNGLIVSVRQARNKDIPKRCMGNQKIFNTGVWRTDQLERSRAEIAASFPLWDEKLKLVRHPDARSWLASLLYWQLYSEIAETMQAARTKWREYLNDGAGEISADDFIKEIAAVGLDKRVLTMQCRGCVSFPDHLRP